MPLFTLNTNVSKEKIPDEFLKTTADIVAKALSKPVMYVVVQVNADQMISWGGASGPCATATLGSIGQLGKEQNKAISAVLYKHIEKELGIKNDRMYINFENLRKEDVGYMGSTFDDLM